MSREFCAMRSSLMILLMVVASGLGNPVSSKASTTISTNISTNTYPTSKNVVFVVHNIRRVKRSKSDDGDSFNLGENLLDMNEETMELAMEETGTLKEATENTMLREELVETTGEEEERKGLVQQAEVDSKLQRTKLDDDNVFDLGENVLDMNEDTMELAMEEDEVEEMDIKESPVQAEVNSRVHSFLAIC